MSAFAVVVMMVAAPVVRRHPETGDRRLERRGSLNADTAIKHLHAGYAKAAVGSDRLEQGLPAGALQTADESRIGSGSRVSRPQAKIR